MGILNIGVNVAAEGLFHYFLFYLKSKQNSCRNCAQRKYVGKIGSCYFNNIKKSAKNRRRGGIEFNITQEQLWDLYKQQNGKCIYSGLDIDFGDTKYEQTHGVTTASLDRIDSAGGYTNGNIQYVHKDINFMKQVFPENLFFYYITRIIQFDRTFKRLENYKLDHSMLNRPHQFKGYGDISGTYWGKVKQRAEKHKVIFNLKIEEVWEKIFRSRRTVLLERYTN